MTYAKLFTLAAAAAALSLCAVSAVAQSSDPSSSHYLDASVPTVGADNPGPLDSVPDRPAMGGYGPLTTDDSAATSGTSDALPDSRPVLPRNTVATERRVRQEQNTGTIAPGTSTVTRNATGNAVQNATTATGQGNAVGTGTLNR